MEWSFCLQRCWPSFNTKARPASVRDWAFHLPKWISISHQVIVDSTLPASLGRGESEAISLAMELNATFVLLDDNAGRKAARHRMLVPAGTLAVLIQASERGLLEIVEAIRQLKSLGFRISVELEERAKGV